MCLPAPYLPIRTTALPLSFTHIRAAGLWFSGSYDTIQILLAAYSREMCFVRSSFPTKSRFSLRCSFDPHGTRGLCQQSCVSAGGTADCQDVIELISGTALPLRGAVTHHILNPPPSLPPSKVASILRDRWAPIYMYMATKHVVPGGLMLKSYVCFKSITC